MAPWSRGKLGERSTSSGRFASGNDVNLELPRARLNSCRYAADYGIFDEGSKLGFWITRAMVYMMGHRMSLYQGRPVNR